MTRRPFLIWPDKRLTETAAPVDAITDDIRVIWDEMIETMDAMPGYGLAAPQIGVALRLAVVDVTDERGHAICFANPEILSASPETSDFDEASPNLPGIADKITRPATVTIRYLDREGQEITREFDGIWATSIQHQIDHLDGRLFFHRLSKLKRDRLLKRWQKQQAAT